VVKMRFKGMLTIGIIPSELEHLKQGQPLRIKLDDLGLKGQSINIIVGDNNERLKKIMEQAAIELEEGRPDHKIQLLS
jgi:hypothetical protein